MCDMTNTWSVEMYSKINRGVDYIGALDKYNSRPWNRPISPIGLMCCAGAVPHSFAERKTISLGPELDLSKIQRPQRRCTKGNRTPECARLAHPPEKALQISQNHLWFSDFVSGMKSLLPVGLLFWANSFASETA